MSTSERVWIAWGLLGTGALVLEASVRLSGIVGQAFATGAVSNVMLAVGGLWVLANAYGEGYRGFHRSFCPRAVELARRAANDERLGPRLLCPLVCMSLIYVPRRRLIAGWGLVGGIVALVVAVRLLPLGWRAVVDAGVVAGLSVGLISLLIHFASAIRSEPAGSEALAPLIPLDPERPTTARARAA